MEFARAGLDTVASDLAVGLTRPGAQLRGSRTFLVVTTTGVFFSLPLAGFKKLSPLASFFLLLRQKKETKDKAVKQLWTALAGPEGIKAQLLQKATPDRSTALALNSFSWSEG